MTEFPVVLDSLIAYVKARHPTGDPLQNLSDSVEVADQIGDQADALIGHFVDQARRSGASWSQIGTSMGVSKQAAQKRFVPKDTDDPERFSRFTDRCRRTVAAAGLLAGNAAVSDVHLAAGLLVEPNAIAAKVIHAAGITDEQVLGPLGAEMKPTIPGWTPTDLQKITFDDAGKDVLAGALRAALKLRHNYIGTEHVLLGVMRSGGRAAITLTGLGLDMTL